MSRRIRKKVVPEEVLEVLFGTLILVYNRKTRKLKSQVENRREAIDKVFSLLSQKQREALNIMAMAQMELLPVHERQEITELLNEGLKKNLVKDYYLELFEKTNLKKAIANIERQKKRKEVNGV